MRPCGNIDGVAMPTLFVDQEPAKIHCFVKVDLI